jgi:hypothetical protein
MTVVQSVAPALSSPGHECSVSGSSSLQYIVSAMSLYSDTALSQIDRHICTASCQVLRGVQVAINGCGHGDLDMIYATIRDAERRGNMKVDLLICCGDFQAMRNVDDLHCFACPPKYRAMKDFHKYYMGEKKAPIPTIFGVIAPQVCTFSEKLKAFTHASWGERSTHSHRFPCHRHVTHMPIVGVFQSFHQSQWGGSSTHSHHF